MDITQEQANEILANETSRGVLFETLSSNEEGKAYLNNHAENYFEEKVKPKIGEIYGNIDKDLKELGFDKKEGVKTFDFIKSTITDLKEKAGASDPLKLETLQKQNEELQAKLNGGEGASHFKDLYEKTKSDAELTIGELNGTINEFKTKEVTNVIKGDLNGSLSGLKFDEGIKKPVLDTYVNNIVKELQANAKLLEDGSIAYYDADGELITNKKTMEKAKASEILASRLSDVLSDKRIVEGGGDGDNRKPNQSLGDYSKATTQGELISIITENLLADGEIKGTEKFQLKLDKLFSEHSKGLPFR